MKRIAVAVVAACSAAASTQVEAYKVTTHDELSGWAAYRSKLQADATLLSDLGLQPWGALPSLPSPEGGMQTVRGLVGIGARVEDDLFPIARSANHFYDHQWQGFQGRGLDGIFDGHPSPVWALEHGGNIHHMGEPGPVGDQLRSYRHAQDAFWYGLTASDPAIRASNFAYTFQTLGHVIHHVQDMAQPEHTRNDMHLPGTEYYEWYSEDRNNTIQSIIQSTESAHWIPTFPDVRQFFATPNAGPFYIGMAEFTGQNYASIDTPLAVVRTSSGYTVGPNAQFPRPNGVNLDGTQMQVVAAPVSVVTTNGYVINGYVDTLVGDVFDGFYNRTLPDQKLGMTSGIWSHMGGGQLMQLSPPMWDEQHLVLWPRAVAFSAGLINHFFRGRVNLARASSGPSWVITNTSTVQLNGTFSVYAESTTGVRQPVGGAQFTLNLAPSASTTVAFPEPPAGTSKLVLAFRGQAGAEVPPDPGFAAVAGKVIPYTVPPVACAGTTKRNGGVGGLNITRTLGSTAANVQLEFEAYSIPDGLVVRSENGAQTQLATTSGLVSGRHTWNIAYNPNTLGSTSVRIQVTAPDPGTAWNLVMGCPGQTIGNGDRDFPLVPVTFRFGSLSQGPGLPPPSGACTVSIWIDGSQAFTTTVNTSSIPRVVPWTLSTGQGHGIEYKNYGANCSSTVGLIPSANITDPAGHTHTLPNYNMTNQPPAYFDIH